MAQEHRRGRSLACVLALCLASQSVRAQAVSHTSTMVTVAPDVRLEVLDWGGRGPALVFLAGFGDTGHVFDGFAPQFTASHHVLAITRRGFGASSHPVSGYDSSTLARDITTVLDSLHISRATFVGHSFAGTELTRLGAFHAPRVDALIYLDASYDFARLYADPRWKRAFPIPKPSAPTSDDMVAWRRWYAMVTGPGIPDHEIALLGASNGPDRSTQLQSGAGASVFSRIRAPVLALWATPRSVRDQYPYWSTLDAAGQAQLQASFTDQEAVRKEHLDRFRRALPTARVQTVSGGRHFLFLSHPEPVRAAMRRFLAK